MADDLQRLDAAEKKLLEAVNLASQAVERLTAGDVQGAQTLSSQLLDAVQESQITLLQMADKYAEPLPYASDAYAEELKAAAAAAGAAAAQQAADEAPS